MSTERRGRAVSGLFQRRFLLIGFWVAVVLMLIWRLGPSLLGIQVLTGYDMLDRFAPWSALETAGDEHIGNPFITDQLDSQLPAAFEIRERLADGDWPLYSNLVQGGTALMVTPSLGFLVPPRLAWLVLPLEIAPAWTKLLELAFSIGFTYLFGRRLGFSRTGASVAGFVVAFFGFAVAWSGWPQSSVIAMAPMLFWAVERFVQQRRWRDLVPVALASAFLLLGGFPVVAGHTFVFAGFYALVRLLISEQDVEAPRSWLARLRDLSLLAGGVLTGALLSMFQLLPFAELTVAGATLDYRSDWSSIQDPPSTWLTAFLPRSVITDAAFQDQAAYLGTVAFVLAAIGLLAVLRGALPRGVGALFIGVGMFVVAFISFQSIAGWGALINDLPLLADNPPGRLRAQLALPIGLIAGLGVQWLTDRPLRGAWRGPQWLIAGFAWPALVMVLLAGSIAVGLSLRYAPFAELRGVSYLHEDLAMAVFPLLAVVVIVVVAVAAPRVRAVAVLAIGVAMVVQSLVPTSFFWPTADPDEVYPPNETVEFLAERVGHDQLGTAGLVLRPNVPNIDGIRLVNGHAFATTEWREALEAADPQAFWMGGTYSMLSPGRATLFENPTLDRMGVRFVAAAADEYAGGRGIPVPLPGAPDRTESELAETEVVEQLDASGLSGTLTGEWTDINGVVVPLALDGAVAVEAFAFDAAGVLVAENLLYFESPGTEIELPIALAVPQGVTVERVDVAVTPEPVDAGLSEVAVALDGGGLVAWVNAPGPEMADYPLVFAGENVLVWERTTALDRIRLSVAADGGDQLSDGQGSVEVVTDHGDRIEVRVTSRSDANLVVVQSLEGLYQARVDGQAVDILAGVDGAGVIPVTAGTHEVEIVFAPKSLRWGFLLSGIGLVLLLFLAAAGPINDARWRRASARVGGPVPLPDAEQ